MAKFHYKFEAIKKVKEALEKKAQKEIAVIDLEIKKLEDEYKRLTELDLKSKKEFVKVHVSAGELQFMKGYELFLQKQRELITNKINKLNEKRKIKLDELVHRSKEHKIFNMLEEHHLNTFNSEQNKLELDQINEIATQKFVRQEK